MKSKKNNNNQIKNHIESIKYSGKSIYDEISPTSELWFSNELLEDTLKFKLVGKIIPNVPIRSRSKIIKTMICESLGYPTPPTFKKTQPRFYGQNFDLYVQKSKNLQIWNEEIDLNRRYVIVIISDEMEIINIKIITGQNLILLDKTGTMTSKYQARIPDNSSTINLISKKDTDQIIPYLTDNYNVSLSSTKPNEQPTKNLLLPIQQICKRIESLIGTSIKDPGLDQERNRGNEFHIKVIEKLGFNKFKDDGQFPDIINQLIEVKLQTSPTIDLGLVLPTSNELLLSVDRLKVSHCDVRYLIGGGKTDGENVIINKLFLVSGKDFFQFFQLMEGKVVNKKIQIPLPKNFFIPTNQGN
jgi:hypothetical protein